MNNKDEHETLKYADVSDHSARLSKVDVKSESSNGELRREMTRAKDPISKNVFDIQPLVYSFRIPRNPSPGSIMTAILPPYWLYHDHAFGVIWMLFHQDENHIGISQLQWCLRFLLDLKNTDGEYTGDVNVCIQAVQDNLIEQYAKLGMALERQGERTKSESIENASARNVREFKGFEDDFKIKWKTSAKMKERLDVKSEGGIDVTSAEGEGNNTIPPTTTARRVVKEERADNANCTVKCRMGQSQGFPATLSITYDEMVSRGPDPCTEQTPIEQIFEANVALEDSIRETSDYTAPPPKTIALSDMGVEELVHFLNDTRRQHVERIKEEIQRLYELEKFMESVDAAKAFSAYVTDDLARRLNRLEGRDVVKETEKMI